MSIINAFIRPDCGIVCADTEAGPDGGPYSNVSKLVPLPHLNAVVAFRGSLAFAAAAISGLFCLTCDFDELAAQMPALLKAAAEHAVAMIPRYAPELSSQADRERVGTGEAVIVGFSPSRSRIVGYGFRRNTLAEDFAGGETNYLVAPGWHDVDFDVQNLKLTADKESMKKLALTQLRLVRERELAGVAAGGRLIYAEVRCGAMIIETVMDFPERRWGAPGVDAVLAHPPT
jgi:hypothetical protein